MPQRKVIYNIKGMVQDQQEEIMTQEYSFENKNIRFTTIDSNTNLSMVNEKGTYKIEDIIGIPIGCYCIDKYVIVWTTLDGDTNNKDIIYRGYINSDNELQLDIWWQGNINLNSEYPIEALGIFENNDTIKVYWTDNNNQPRIANIVQDLKSEYYDFYNFDFIPKINGETYINVEETTGTGIFASGVIQYCFTFVDEFGQESNIVDITNLLPIKLKDRGASSAVSVNTCFKIEIHKLPLFNSFKKIRLYSIQYTTYGGSTICRLVTEYNIAQFNTDQITPDHSITIIDNGTNGSSIENSRLLYVGGYDIKCNTLCQKDLTMFYGGISEKRKLLSSLFDNKCNLPTQYYNGISINVGTIQDNTNKAGFHSNETYRLGFQCQFSNGKWSDAVWIKDIDINNNWAESLSATIILNDLKDKVNELDIIALRPLIVDSGISDRSVIAQGVANPCIYEINDRKDNSPYIQSSWFTRLLNPVDVIDHYCMPLESGCDKQLPLSTNYNCEIQNNIQVPDYLGSDKYFTYKVCHNFLTFHSPDIELDPATKTIDLDKLNAKIVGYVYNPIFYNDCEVISSSDPTIKVVDSAEQKSYNTSSYCTSTGQRLGGLLRNFKSVTRAPMCTYPMWEDWVYGLKNKLSDGSYLSAKYIVYPWNRSKSLSNCTYNGTNEVPCTIKNKKMSITHKLQDFKYTNIGVKFNNIYRWDSDNPTLIKLNTYTSDTITKKVYYGVIDKIASIKEGEWETTVLDTSYDVTTNYYYIRKSDNKMFKCVYVDTTFSSEKNVHADYGVVEYNNKYYLVYSYDIAVSGSREESDYEVFHSFWYNKQKYIHIEYNGSITDDNTDNFFDILDNGGGEELEQISSSSLTYTNIGKYIYNKFDKSTSYDWEDDINQYSTTDAINIKYKSGYHLLLEKLSDDGNDYDDFDLNTIIDENNWLPIVQIYQTPSNPFGGININALKNNIWRPCGKRVKFDINGTTLVWEYGDTYLTRHESLRTYPYTMDDVCSVVDIVSYLVETRVNINDCRIDKNKDNVSNLTATPEYFNVTNWVYNQKNDYFLYQCQVLEDKDDNLDDNYNYETQLTWSLTKTIGESIDSWCNVIMTNTLALDGDKGKIRKIINVSDNLFAFQDKCISRINFNSRAALTSEEGIPIEIGNSGKVEGKTNLTEIGCTNKWSICQTPTGVYFIDELTNSMYVFDGSNITSISDNFYFHSWFKNNDTKVNEVDYWTPKNFDYFVVYYDYINKDVFCISKDNCLCLNENLKCFTSFYSYDRTPYMFTMNDRMFCLRQSNKYIVNEKAIKKNKEGEIIHDGIINEAPFETLSECDTDSVYSSYELKRGDYNYFFNVYKNFYIHWVSNKDYTIDKIFDNIEFRSDTYNKVDDDYNINHFITFDTLTAWTEYQYGIFKLFNRMGYPSNLKKKFRVWRANIPRALMTDKNRICTHNPTHKLVYRFQDRIRNTWCNLKLSYETPNNNKTILHDLVVQYFDNVINNQQQ